MDQQLNNNQYEFLSKLLANPVDDAPSYFNDLQRLVDDYPQSGILQALLAYSSEEKNVKQAAAYFSSGQLFKLINDISSLPGVSEDRIIIEKSLLSKNRVQTNRYQVELTGNITEDNQEDPTGIGENYFSDPAESGHGLDGNDNGDKPEIHYDEDLSSNSAEISEAELPILFDGNLNGLTAFTPVQSEVNNGNFEEAVEESVNRQDIPPSEPAEGVSEEAPFDVPVMEIIDADEQLGFKAEDTVATGNDFESPGSVTVNDDIVPDSLDPDENPDAGNTIFANSDTYRNENIGLQADYIDDEVFDEILGIEYIDISPEPAKETPGVGIDQEPGTDGETEQKSAEEIIFGDFFKTENTSQEDQQPELSEEKLSPERETEVWVTDQKPIVNNEQQDVAKYNDDKMPYTFMWWLEKTRQQHSGIFQPYVKPDTEEVSAVPKHGTDELQQQYYENIFHITSIEEIEKNIPHPPFAAVPKKKEQVIIERFIKEEPQIRPQSSDKLDNENKAKKSAEDKDELVTETLAVIYHDQMLYHKAIASYKKLMLKFPEKSGYFADKIAQVEKKIN